MKNERKKSKGERDVRESALRKKLKELEAKTGQEWDRELLESVDQIWDLEQKGMLSRALPRASEEERLMLGAAWLGNAELIEKLARAGVSPDVSEPDGKTVLMRIVSQSMKSESARSVEALVRAGADVSLTDKFGSAALDYLKFYGESCLDVGLRLMEAGASAQGRDLNGKSALMRLASQAPQNEKERVKSRVLAKRFIQQKGALEQSDLEGKTALHWAALSGELGWVEWLLAEGANVEAKDKDGKTPMSWAEEKNQSAVVNCLRSRKMAIEEREALNLAASQPGKAKRAIKTKGI